MFDSDKLNAVIAVYKQDFMAKQWEDEKYKWEAVRHFQQHWDINASDFAAMFMTATNKTDTLLASMNYYPRGMIKAFAKADPEATRAMFIGLFDENRDMLERIVKFQTDADAIREKYDDGTWKQHYQQPNSITTYLWLRYPDKYYIYKYSEVRAAAKALGSSFVPQKGATEANVLGAFSLYNEICNALQQDAELVQLLRSVVTPACYPDPQLKTLTADIGFYIGRYYAKGQRNTPAQWFPEDYSPGLTVEQWVELLGYPSVFNQSSLEIMKRLKDYGGAATCSQLSIKYGASKNFYNAGSSALAKRVEKKTDCPVPSKDTKNSKWWPILYVGRYAEKEDTGIYIWKLRDELNAALEKTDLSEVPLYAYASPAIGKISHGTEAAGISEANKNEIELYSKVDFLNEVYMPAPRYDALVSLLKNKKNLILHGAPGVGKTFAAKRLAYAMMGEKDDSRIEFIQFHQNYSYEDFIMGYKPQDEGFQLHYGIFYRFCQQAANMPDEDYFFIIDEINRGNMSKIFGELLMLIERDYRGINATLAYNGMPFSVPPNLYLIGMMNTADRSLAMIDYALRRRFSFFPMEPGFASEGFTKYREQLDNDTFNTLIERIKKLNKEIIADGSLGKGFCMGHSYFCNQTECTENWLKEIVEYDILPMLSEYWFDEPTKVLKWENILRGVFDD